MPSDRHRTHEARHVPHDAARNARFSIGVVNAAYIGIFSVGLHLTGRRPDAAMVDAVLSRSEGNPFLAEELVAADVLSGQLPEGLRNLLLARTLDLPEAARQVVGLVAVAGLSVDHELLEEAWLAAYG